MKRFAAQLAALVLVAGGLALLATTQARARVPVELLEVARTMPAASGLVIDSFTVTCATTATEITPGTGELMHDFACVNTSATDVAVGDSGIAAPASANSPVISTSAAAGAVWQPGAAGGGYCRVDSGTVTLYCSATIAGSP